MLCPHCLDAELGLDNRNPYEVKSIYCPKCGYREYEEFIEIKERKKPVKVFKKEHRINKVRVHVQEDVQGKKIKHSKTFTVYDATLDEVAKIVGDALDKAERKES